jgi:hypothetical protein
MAIAFKSYDDAYDSVAGPTIATDSPLTVAVNDMIIVIVYSDDSGTNDGVVTSVTDNYSNTYTKAIGQYYTGSTYERIEIWYARVTTGGSLCLVTANFTSTVALSWISASVFSGIDYLDPLDDTGSQTQGATTDHATGTMTATSSGALVIGGYAGLGNENMISGANFFHLSSDLTSVSYYGEYRIINFNGSTYADCHTGTTQDSIMAGAVFKMSGASVPPPAGTNMSINIGDVWKSVDSAKINIGDAWKAVASAKVNIGDAWKTIF